MNLSGRKLVIVLLAAAARRLPFRLSPPFAAALRVTRTDDNRKRQKGHSTAHRPRPSTKNHAMADLRKTG
jgi:hypothetical protein